MKDYVLVKILGQAKTYDGNGTVNVYHSGIRKALIKASEIITIYEVNENTFSMKVTYQATPILCDGRFEDAVRVMMDD